VAEGLESGLRAAGPIAATLDDASLTAFAESVELAVAAAYDAAATQLDDPVDARTGAVYAAHHRSHAEAFARLAGSSGGGTANARLATVLAGQLAALTAPTDVVRFLVGLENRLAATHQYLSGALTNAETAALVATVLPVEAAHAAVLGLLLGGGPRDVVPGGGFQSPVLRFDPSQFPVS